MDVEMSSESEKMEVLTSDVLVQDIFNRLRNYVPENGLSCPEQVMDVVEEACHKPSRKFSRSGTQESRSGTSGSRRHPVLQPTLSHDSTLRRRKRPSQNRRSWDEHCPSIIDWDTYSPEERQILNVLLKNADQGCESDEEGKSHYARKPSKLIKLGLHKPKLFARHRKGSKSSNSKKQRVAKQNEAPVQQREWPAPWPSKSGLQTGRSSEDARRRNAHLERASQQIESISKVIEAASKEPKRLSNASEKEGHVIERRSRSMETDIAGHKKKPSLSKRPSFLKRVIGSATHKSISNRRESNVGLIRGGEARSSFSGEERRKAVQRRPCGNLHLHAMIQNEMKLSSSTNCLSQSSFSVTEGVEKARSEYSSKHKRLQRRNSGSDVHKKSEQNQTRFALRRANSHRQKSPRELVEDSETFFGAFEKFKEDPMALLERERRL
eukprot:Seg3037.2 transcript_id=Seg3037.2/GoldUCD/mRNA.D3Y31 product="hypothetical protein" protein_id=Seg3037.2/GoldUCD/D3Y31